MKNAPTTPPNSPPKKTRQFTLRSAVESSPLKYQIMTTLPRTSQINELWKIDQTLSNKITKCFTMIYNHILERNANGEGKENFFHHVVSIALYEIFYDKPTKGKFHGIKAGTTYIVVNKTLNDIELFLAHTKNLPQTQREIIENFQTVLIAHKNILVIGLKKLSDEKQKHLKTHQNLDIQSLEVVELTPTQRERIAQMHPKPQPNTPKRLTREAKKSQRALQAKEPPPLCVLSQKLKQLGDELNADQVLNPLVQINQCTITRPLTSSLTLKASRPDRPLEPTKSNPAKINVKIHS